MNISVKANARIIKLYEFFNIVRLRRITAQTRAFPNNAREAIIPNVTLKVVREWSILLLLTAGSILLLFTAGSVWLMETVMALWFSRRCYLTKRIKVLFNGKTKTS